MIYMLHRRSWDSKLLLYHRRSLPHRPQKAAKLEDNSLFWPQTLNLRPKLPLLHPKILWKVVKYLLYIAPSHKL